MKRGRDVIEPWYEQSDETLLRAFKKSGSEEAFRELVNRHLGMVLGVAMRRIGDRGHAEDAAQSVFTALAAKAKHLTAGPSLGAWLYRATLVKCSEIIRSEQARKRKMEAFSNQALIDSEGQSIWREALPVLDEAIDALPAADRDLVLLRFFECRSFAQIGAVAGKSENAVQKQCERALDRLSHLLRRKGVAIPAAALAAGLSAGMTQSVPAGLAMTISQSAVAVVSAMSTGPLTLHILEIMAHAKTKALAALAVAAVGIPVAHHLSSPKEAVPSQSPPETVQRDSSKVRPLTEISQEEESQRPAVAPFAGPSAPARTALSTAPPEPESPAAPEQPAPTDLIAASPFRASISATLQPGDSLVTGGWATAPGMRTFVFITPTAVEATTPDRRQMVSVSPLVVEAQEAVWRALGFDTILTHAPDSTVNETLSSELAGQLMQAFKEVVPDALKARPRIMALPGQQTVMTMGQAGGNFSTIRLTPGAPGPDGAIALEAKIGLGHGPTPGLTGIAPASLAAPPAPGIP